VDPNADTHDLTARLPANPGASADGYAQHGHSHPCDDQRCADWGQPRPATHAVAEVLREVRHTVAAIDSFGPHGAILRSDVHRALDLIAHAHGIVL